MDRSKFAYSRVLIEYEDGTAVGTCSIHCAVLDLALKMHQVPKSIKVSDYLSRALTGADQAFWVIGGIKTGVMTKRAKWAFASQEMAYRFTIDNGGDVFRFDAVLKAAYEDIYAETQRARDEQKMSRIKHPQ